MIYSMWRFYEMCFIDCILYIILVVAVFSTIPGQLHILRKIN